MVEKKKMSVADMIAMARKSDGGASDAAPAPAPASNSDTGDSAHGESPAPTAEAKPTPAAAKSASGGRPSVAEMLAAARAGDSAKKAESATKAEPAAAPAPAAKKPAPKPAVAKAEPASTTPAEPRDTASILSAARKSSKAGPMSKSEAAAKVKADPKAAEKPKIIVPPMPPKPAYAMPKSEAPAKAKPSEQDRRGFLSMGFWNVGIASTLWGLAVLKFMFPNVRREPPSKFKVGAPDAFPPGQVSDKFKAQFGVWVVNTEYNGEQQLFALKTVCTHLGCTPNWLEAEQKFKCPCHGSGFYKDGINFEGPAPRPLERFAISVAGDGQVEIDKSRTFQEEMGQWQDPACYIPA